MRLNVALRRSPCRLDFFGLLLAALTGCATAPEPNPGPQPYVLTLAQGNKGVIPEEGLTVELLSVTDNRCPPDVQCVWAGHATVTVSVEKLGAGRERLTIGTPAPTNLKLPFEASYGPYRLTLVGLEPPKSSSSPVAQSAYRATVRVTRF